MADCVRTNNIRDLTCSNQHIQAMSFHCKLADGSSISSEPIVVNMLQKIPEDIKSKLRKKFGIAYFEKLAYSKYPAICELDYWNT